MSVKGLDMISFTSGGGEAGAICAASAQAAIAMGRKIFFIAITSGLAQICFSFKVDHRRNASHFRQSTLDCRGKRFSNRKGNENMKTKLSAVALVASAVTIAQANPGGVHAVAGGSHRGAVGRSAPAVHAPMRPGGLSTVRPTPMRSPGRRAFLSGH